MKATMEYMVGNTAVQIINTGNKIKVIDVEKQRIRKSIWKHLSIALTITGMLITLCFYVVRLENQKNLLDQSVYHLQAQVDEIKKENKILKKQEEETPIDYDVLYQKARKLGMKFPSNQQVGTYSWEKSTAVRIKKIKNSEK